MNELLTPPSVHGTQGRRVSAIGNSQSKVLADSENSTQKVIEKWISLTIKYDPYEQAAHAEFYAAKPEEKMVIVKVRAVLKSRVQRLNRWSQN